MTAIEIDIHEDNLHELLITDEIIEAAHRLVEFDASRKAPQVLSLFSREKLHIGLAARGIEVQRLAMLDAPCVEALDRGAVPGGGEQRLGIAVAVDEAAVVRDDVGPFHERLIDIGEVVHDRLIWSAGAGHEEHAELAKAAERIHVCRGDAVCAVEKGLVHIACDQLVHRRSFRSRDDLGMGFSVIGYQHERGFRSSSRQRARPGRGRLP